MKIKSLISLVLFGIASLTANAQIQLTPVASGNVEGFNGDTKGQIENKLRNILTSKKIMSKMGESRFVLAAHMSILEKEILGTAPTKICYRLNVQLAIGDGVTGNCFGTSSMEIKGVGNTENKAVTNAIRSLNARNPKIGELVVTGTKSIYEYYENNIDAILQSAESLANTDELDKALLELSVVPKEIKEYSKVNELIIKLYKERVNRNAAKILNEAKAKWAGNPTPENGVATMAIIAEIDPSSSSFEEAQKFMKEVNSKIDAIHKQERLDARQDKLDAMQMERERMKSIEKIAIAEAQNQPKVVYNLQSWWW